MNRTAFKAPLAVITYGEQRNLFLQALWSEATSDEDSPQSCQQGPPFLAQYRRIHPGLHNHCAYQSRCYAARRRNLILPSEIVGILSSTVRANNLPGAPVQYHQRRYAPYAELGRQLVLDVQLPQVGERDRQPGHGAPVLLVLGPDRVERDEDDFDLARIVCF